MARQGLYLLLTEVGSMVPDTGQRMLGLPLANPPLWSLSDTGTEGDGATLTPEPAPHTQLCLC